MHRKQISLPVEPSVLKWLRSSAGLSLGDVAKLLDLPEGAYLKLENGQAKPTLTQVEQLAKSFHRPLTAFLLPEPAAEAPLPRDFRLKVTYREFSEKLRLAFRKARGLQDSSRELMINLGLDTNPKIKKRRLSDDPAEAAAVERAQSGVSTEQQTKWKHPYEAFNFWRAFLEQKNIQVFQISMPIEEARGFSLTDANPFVIVVNTKDSISGRIFTLLHEYAHLLLSESSVCLPESVEASARKEAVKAEVWCNRFSAEFLLPPDTESQLTGFSDAVSRPPPEYVKLLQRYSSRFKVSRHALLVRIKEFGLLPQTRYSEILEELLNTPGKKSQGGKGQTRLEKCQSEKGPRYISMVMENLERGLITSKDALDKLSVKLGNLEELKSSKWVVFNG